MTLRQVEVVQLINEGLTHEQAGKRLGVGRKAVTRIMAAARRHGLSIRDHRTGGRRLVAASRLSRDDFRQFAGI